MQGTNYNNLNCLYFLNFIRNNMLRGGLKLLSNCFQIHRKKMYFFVLNLIGPNDINGLYKSFHESFCNLAVLFSSLESQSPGTLSNDGRIPIKYKVT